MKHLLTIPTRFENDRGEPLNVPVIDYRIIGKLKDVVQVQITTFVTRVSLESGSSVIVMPGNRIGHPPGSAVVSEAHIVPEGFLKAQDVVAKS